VATVEAVRPARKRVRIGAPDPSLTGCSGLAALAEFADQLEFAPMLDRHIGPKRSKSSSLPVPFRWPPGHPCQEGVTPFFLQSHELKSAEERAGRRGRVPLP